MPFILLLVLAFLPVWLSLGCSPTHSQDGSTQENPQDPKGAPIKAPELLGGLGWLNTDKPLTLKDLRGKVVLLDFWTFCCANCMHVIPDLKKLEHKYPHELVVIGVHSAKFANEKETNHIREAVLRYGVEHPVVNDADFRIWNAYGVNSWPTLIVINPDGYVIGSASGEGNFNVLDKTIESTIAEFDKQGKIKRTPMHFLLESSKTAATPLAFPGKITCDPATKRLYISDSGHNRIVVSDNSGKLINVIGSGQVGHADGSFASASFDHPQGLALHDGILYVADTENHLLRKIDLAKNSVSTIAGTGQEAGLGTTGGPARVTSLNSPWDLTYVGGKLYIAMAGSHQLWVMDLAKDTIRAYAGTGSENIVDDELSRASLAQPSGITSDGKNLYFADSEVSAVRTASLPDEDKAKSGATSSGAASSGAASSGRISTIVGKGLFEFGDQDGTGQAVRLQHPLGVLWHDGVLYIADSYNHKIKSAHPDTKTVTTLLGSGKSGFHDGTGTDAQFSEPAGLAAIGNTLYIADTNNNAIRTADLKTLAVNTLKITGLTAPTQQTMVYSSSALPPHDRIPTPLPKVDPDKLPKFELPPQSKGKLVIDLILPKGYSMAPNSATIYQVTPQGDALVFDKLALHHNGVTSLRVAVPFTTGKDGSNGQARVTVTVYYCLDSKKAESKTQVLQIDAAAHISTAAKSKDIKITKPVLANPN